MMNVFKLNYNWYEGEHGDCLVISSLDVPEFEKLLKEGIEEVSKYQEREAGSDLLNVPPKTFTVRCLPSAYDFLVEYLEEHDCQIAVPFKYASEYYVDDGNEHDTFKVQRKDTEIEWCDL